jgi:drug/metabolite transporter (DMT)-like permease
MTNLNYKVTNLPDKKVLAAFFFFILIGGGAAVAIRISYKEMAPFWLATSRFALGAIAFWVIVLYRGIKLPKGRALIGSLIFGILIIGLSYIFKAWGLVTTQAGLYQILMTLVPLLTLFLSAFHKVESITVRGIIGAILALAGIVIIFSGASPGEISIPHIAAILLAALLMAEGGVLLKKFPSNPPILTNAIGMTVGAFILGITSLINGEEWRIPSQLETWIAFLYLVLFVTLLGFMLYLFILNKWTASGTSYGFVMFPLVTIIAAAVLTEESITVNLIIGALLVLSGVLFGAILSLKGKEAGIEECKEESGKVLANCN